MNIEEIMSKPAVTCQAYDSLNTAAKLMWDCDCGAVPVTDHAGSLIGIVTDRDICMAAYTKGLPLASIQVADVMAKQVFWCRAGDPLEAAETLMAQKQIRRVPIVDENNRPIGLLSLGDIARFATGGAKRNGHDRQLTQTLGAVSQRRARTIAARP